MMLDRLSRISLLLVGQVLGLAVLAYIATHVKVLYPSLVLAVGAAPQPLARMLPGIEIFMHALVVVCGCAVLERAVRHSKAIAQELGLVDR